MRHGVCTLYPTVHIVQPVYELQSVCSALAELQPEPVSELFFFSHVLLGYVQTLPDTVTPAGGELAPPSTPAGRSCRVSFDVWTGKAANRRRTVTAAIEED